MSRAHRRDLRVYLCGHPVLFALLAVTRPFGVVRLGGTVLVHDTRAYRDALTRLPLNRAAAKTTGGVARELTSGGLLFDQDGGAHRGTRRLLADGLGRAGVQRLRPVWRSVLGRRFEPLSHGGTVDVVDVAAELSGATVCALLEIDADPWLVAQAARDAAAAAVRAHLPGMHRPGVAAAETVARLAALVGTDDDTDGNEASGLAAMLAVAAVNTTAAGLPRAVAWCCDDGLWSQAAGDDTLPVLVAELLRVTSPTPLLPRVAGADGVVGGHPVRAGDRLMLVARHAAGGHRGDPGCARPAPAHVAQLVFGAGPHACPGAGLARAQLSDTLGALAPYRPAVVRARADRRSALPGWASLVVRATGTGRRDRGTDGAADGGPDDGGPDVS